MKIFIYSSIFFVVTIFSSQSFAFIKQKGAHELVFGYGYTSLHKDFGEHGESAMTPSLGYYYARENVYFAAVDFHAFKKSSNGESFSSKSVNMSIGYNVIKFEGFYLAPIAGLGFYLPKATRNINGILKDTNSKIVFGANFGAEAYLSLNEQAGFSFKFHFHRPFTARQDIGGRLEGHYTTLSVNISRKF